LRRKTARSCKRRPQTIAAEQRDEIAADHYNRVLDVALEMTRAALGLADNFADGIIARQIVELSRAGERNPDLLCEGALKKLGEALFGD
jgi:hypothetical protein